MSSYSSMLVELWRFPTLPYGIKPMVFAEAPLLLPIANFWRAPVLRVMRDVGAPPIGIARQCAGRSLPGNHEADPSCNPISSICAPAEIEAPCGLHAVVL